MSVDMRQDAQFDAMFENLLRHIYDQPALTRPTLGSPPKFAVPVTTPPTVRLASFAIEHWELESGMVMNEQHPKTFWIPDEAVRRSLKPGDIVKLLFEFRYPDGDEIDSERMWVEITELNGPYFVGRRRNSPTAVHKWHALEYDSQVAFLPEHVIDVYEGKLLTPEELTKIEELGRAIESAHGYDEDGSAEE